MDKPSSDSDITRRIHDLIASKGGGHNADLVGDIIETALKLLKDVEDRGDVRVMQTAMRELRYAFRLFAPYADTRKVTIFGSARTTSRKAEYPRPSSLPAGWLRTANQITDDAEQAVKWITRFYRNFHSLRFVKDALVIRLKHAPSKSAIEALNEDFADILAGGRIQAAEPAPDEVHDHDSVELPRLALSFDRRSYGRLRQLIDVLNGY